MAGVHGATQHLAPEASGLIHIGGFAVDQHGTETRMVVLGTFDEVTRDPNIKTD
jgi:hypothetical protein